MRPNRHEDHVSEDFHPVADGEVRLDQLQDDRHDPDQPLEPPLNIRMTRSKGAKRPCIPAEGRGLLSGGGA